MNNALVVPQYPSPPHKKRIAENILRGISIYTIRSECRTYVDAAAHDVQDSETVGQSPRIGREEVNQWTLCHKGEHLSEYSNG